MASDRTESPQSNSASTAPSTASDELTPQQNFLIAFLFGALLSLVGLSISMSMTHTALAEVSSLQWSVVIALPFLLGILSATLKKPFLDTLSAAMNSLPY